MDATPMPTQLCAEWIRNIINMDCILSNVRLHILLYCITQQMAKPINFALTGGNTLEESRRLWQINGNRNLRNSHICRKSQQIKPQG